MTFALEGRPGRLGVLSKGPLLSLHPSVPSEKCFRSDNGNDIPQSTSNGQAVPDQCPSISLRQRYTTAQLAAQNLVLLVKKIVLFGEIFAEELLDSSYEWRGGAAKIGVHSIEDIRSEDARNPQKR